MDTPGRGVKITVMAGRLLTTALLAAAFLAGCRNGRGLNMLEREMLRFRAENERIRGEDLQAEYDRQKSKADALSEDLLALTRQRDRLFAEYDALRADLARLERERKGAEDRRDALARMLADTRAELTRLKQQIEAERQALAAAAEERTKLDAAAAGGRGP